MVFRSSRTFAIPLRPRYKEIRCLAWILANWKVMHYARADTGGKIDASMGNVPEWVA
jgi:hypothetical protein